MLPELLPLDALAVHALLHEHVPDGIDSVAPAAHIHHELVHAVNEPAHGSRGFSRLAAPRPGRLAHRRHIREARVAARQGTELGVIEEPRGIARPVDQDGRAPVARLVEVGENGAHGHHPDLLGHEDGAARIRSIEDEAARRPLELDRIACLERAQPLRAEPAGGHVHGQGDGPPPRGRGQGEGASNVEGALNLIYELLNLGNSSAAKISICRASSAASQIASRTKYEHPASMKRWSCSAHWAGVPMMPYFRARGPKSWA